MICIWQIYGAVTHFLVSSYTVKIIYLIVSAVFYKMKLNSLIYNSLSPPRFHCEKETLCLPFSCLPGTPSLPTDFQGHLLTVVQHRPGWSKEPRDEFHYIKLTGKTSHLSPKLFFPCFRLSSYLCYWHQLCFSDRYSLEKAYTQSYQTRFDILKNSKRIFKY